jgi:hypothetical protein
LEETLTLHRLQVPVELWKTLRSTNVIESAFSIVRKVCRNVKRWRPGNQIERWVGSGLVVAENQFRRIDGHRALPGLLAAIEAANHCMLYAEIYNAEESFSYLLSRTLMRPRDLLRFARQCVNVAVNRGHVKVLENDILTAEKTYSEDQLQDVSFELRDVSPSCPDVLYAFIGSRHLLSRPEVCEKLREAGVLETDLARILTLLVWFGFLGFVASEDEGERYSYQFQHRVDRMAIGLKPTPIYAIHPTFRVAFGCPS